jgi:hypothetical protein
MLLNSIWRLSPHPRGDVLTHRPSQRPKGREKPLEKEEKPLPFLGGLLDGIIRDSIDAAYDPSAQVG